MNWTAFFATTWESFKALSLPMKALVILIMVLVFGLPKFLYNVFIARIGWISSGKQLFTLGLWGGRDPRVVATTMNDVILFVQNSTPESRKAFLKELQKADTKKRTNGAKAKQAKQRLLRHAVQNRARSATRSTHDAQLKAPKASKTLHQAVAAVK